MPTPIKGPARATRRPARSDRKSKAAAGRSPRVSASQPEIPQLTLARDMLNASLAPYQGLLRIMAQVRETQADMLHQMEQLLDATRRRAEQAGDLQELARLQGAMASDNLGRSVNAASALFRSWLETESALLEEAQFRGSAMTQQWLGDAPVSTDADKSEPAHASDPALALLTQAQAAWAQMTQQWIDTLRDQYSH